MALSSEKQIRTGDGWRIGWDPGRSPYCGLLGTDDWATELTLEEFQDIRRLVFQLVETVQHIQSELMDEERLCCEAESDRVWVEIEGYPDAYELRFILLGDRAVEGKWSADAVPHLLKALQMTTIF